MLFWHLGMTALIVFVTIGRRRIDYRIVLLGAVLPDLIDKPLGRILFEERFHTSRLYGHTLAFVVLSLLAVMLFMRGEMARRWFILPIAALLHLGLDAMWDHPITLFWPLFGTRFPPDPVGDYWLALVLRVFEHPAEAIKELIGLGVLVYMGLAFGMTDQATRRRFLRTGRLEAKVEAARPGSNG